MILYRLEKHLSTLKVASLKSIASSCGVDLVKLGTQHGEGDITTIDKEKLIPKNILSFDVGYKNFAFVQINKDYEIKEWKVTDFELGNQVDYHPSILAPYIRKYLCEQIWPLFPQVGHIVVERQRARSASSFNILESTLRVNTVESFLWCILYEFQSIMMDQNNKIIHHQHQHQYKYIPMQPLLKQNIDRLWYDDLLLHWKNHSKKLNHLKVDKDNDNDELINMFHDKLKLTTYEKKLASTMLVQDWLDQQFVKCPSTLMDMFRNRKSNNKKKQDDLSDCLIQAVTWYQWRRNSINHLMEFI
ncbi:unnamed protein product [Cunninghamella blakesleeana]